MRICSRSLRELELDFIKSVFLENGYPLEDIHYKGCTTTAKERTSVWTKEVHILPSLPYIGMASKWSRIAVQKAVHNGYDNAKTEVIFQTRKLLPNLSKDVLPMLATSNVIYKFVCCCDSNYVGRTTQRLGSTIRQYLPK